MQITVIVDHRSIIEDKIQRYLRFNARVFIGREFIIFTSRLGMDKIPIPPAVAKFIAEPTAKMISFEINIPKEYLT